ncbi:MAG: hypothetical protein MUE69_27930 [Myxococcota bacterium]|jgi:hypothetical protein|nr:hypothetical protein [Myxococcota bacterium]
MRWVVGLLFVPCVALAQPRSPACDPIGHPPNACGRMPDGCGGFVDLPPCPEAPRLEVHDVGIWTIERPADPAPSFATVVAGPGPDASWLYVYSTRPLDTLRTSVRYASRRAGWAYPAPVSARGPLEWRGVGAPPHDAGVWSILASGVASPIDGPYRHNGVLLHAGTARFQSPVRVRDGGLVSAEGEHSVWIVTGGRGFEEHRVFGRQRVLVQTGDHVRLRQRLLEELVQRGLRDREAEAMLDARRDTLFGERSHVLYFLPRETIERAQPLSFRFEVPPAAVVRVRLVEDHR